jgi:hypothetical protein
MDESLSSKLLTIDGEQARQFRQACRYPGQRKISAGNVERLSLAMRRGTFVQGTSIHFCALPDGTMYLVNGNHCMEAVAACGIPQLFNVVVIPVPDMAAVADVYMNFDTHKQRTWQDALRAQGLDHEVPMADAVTAAIGLIMQGFRYNSTNVEANTDRAKRFGLVRQYEACAAQMHDAIAGAPNLNRRLCLRRAVLGVALETFRYQAPSALGFWGGLAKDDGLASRDPRKTLLRYLLENRAHGGIENFYQSKACSLAWNSFVRGEDLARLRTKVAGPLVLLGTPWSATRDGQQKFPDWLQPKPDMAAPELPFRTGSDLQPKPDMAAPNARPDVQRTSKSPAPEPLFQTGVQVGPNGADPIILYRRRGARS